MGIGIIVASLCGGVEETLLSIAAALRVKQSEVITTSSLGPITIAVEEMSQRMELSS